MSWIDLPTSHWPMWSKPVEITTIIGDIATGAGAGTGAGTGAGGSR